MQVGHYDIARAECETSIGLGKSQVRASSVLSLFFYSLLFYGHAGYNHLFSFCFDIIDFIFIGILAGLEGGGQRINRK